MGIRRRAKGSQAGRPPGRRPRAPQPLLERPALVDAIVDDLRAREGVVAVTGPEGAGKSVLAAQVCRDHRVRRLFRDGMVWLEAGEAQDGVELLAAVADRLGMSGAAAGFAAVEQGRELLGPTVAGKRLLIVVDNVSQRTVIDAFAGLAPGCQVMVTSRAPELAAVQATRVGVGELTVDQSLELLGSWTGQDAVDAQARELCARTGGLALAVTLAGGMAGHGSVARALEQVERSLGGPDSCADTPQGLQTLPHVIEAAMADMPNPWHDWYVQLAVFAGRGPFPADAVRALWHNHPHGGAAGALLDAFAGRGLLTARGGGRYTAHDLLYAAMKARLGPDGLAAAHAQLLDGYRARYPRGWAAAAADPYLGRNLAGHLREARLADALRESRLAGELRAVLADPDWIQARLTAGPAHELIGDYRHTTDPLTSQVMRTLRLHAPALAADPRLVRTHLTNRLLGHPDPGITAWAADLNRASRSGGSARHGSRIKPAHAAAANRPGQILTGHGGPVRAVAINTDGTRAISGSDDGTIRVWDLTTGTEHATLTGHTDWVRAVAISTDGTRAISGSDDGTVRVWDLTTGTEHAALTGHDGEVFTVAITPDGRGAVSGGSDRTLRVWDLRDDSERAILTGHTRPVWSVAVAAGHTRAVSGGGDGTVRIWDLITGTEHAALTGHDGEVFTVAITPSGRGAVSGGGDGTLRAWHLPGRRQHADLTGHSGWVRAVRLASDKPLAVSGGEDASVRVWDLTAGIQRATLTGHHGEVFAVAITPGGDRAISGGSDQTVRIWDLTAIGTANS